MIKWPEPVGALYTIAGTQHCTITEELTDTNLHTEAQLKQAVRDAVEACARVADCRDLPATSAAIRALIKEFRMTELTTKDQAIAHPTPEMQIAGGAVELDYSGVTTQPNTVGWLTAARVLIAMAKVQADARSREQ